ncbi:MAG: diguanylate cyclase, partial [Pseudomonadota bacterium]
AYSVAERIREIVSNKPFAIKSQGISIDVTTSIGIGCYLDASDTPTTLIKRADVGLYRAKNAGRNRVILAAAA